MKPKPSDKIALPPIEDLALMVDLQQELVMSDLDIDKVLALVCHHAQEITLASGAVIETVSGDDMIYRACTPSLHNSLGVRLNLHSSLSGLAYKTNQVLYCRDTETDARVDRDACRKVGVRSMICVPLTSHGAPVGVLKVLSPHVDSFEEREINVLRLLAGVVSAKIAQATEAAAKDAALSSARHNENLFRTLIESAFEAILISQDEKTKFANKSFCQLYGYEPNELIDRSIFDFVAPESIEQCRSIMSADLNMTYEMKALHKNGSPLTVEVTGATLLLNGEKVRISTIRDITLRKHAEDMLRRSELESREANRLKSDFLANMSHEIRTPINGVMGLTGLLLDTSLTAQQRHYAELIKVSADTLLSLVNDVLDFSKIEAGKTTIEEIAFDLRHVIEDIHCVMGVAAERKHLEFTHLVSANLPQMLIGDPTKTRQILANLVTNAIKFTNSGHVKIRATEELLNDDHAVIRFEVTDSGIGLAKDAQAHLFKPFSQADSSTTRRFGGTGLGLSICKKLVEAMCGEIGIESTEGVGSTFWFTLPFRVSCPSEKLDQPIRIHSPWGSHPHSRALFTSPSKLRVLIAEDNAINQMIAVKMVEKLGHTATKVANGREAVEALAIAPYDLILMDCQMPEMDGYQATRAVRESHLVESRDIPIIAMTANAMTGDREKCIASGMNDYIAKPVKVEDLRTVIERTIKNLRRAA